MKTIPKIFEMLADVPRMIIDPESITVNEIADHLKSGRTKALQLVRAKIKSGEWEKVFKLTEGYDRPVPSYRLKKQARK